VSQKLLSKLAAQRRPTLNLRLRIEGISKRTVREWRDQEERKKEKRWDGYSYKSQVPIQKRCGTLQITFFFDTNLQIKYLQKLRSVPVGPSSPANYALFPGIPSRTFVLRLESILLSHMTRVHFEPITDSNDHDQSY
jgi:hypothetical protein